MKNLLLIRHAHALSSQQGQNDFSRDLSPRGEREAQACGKALVDRSPKPSLIICSPAIRTLSTARILAGILKLPLNAVKTASTLYLGNPHDLKKVIMHFPDTVSCAVLVGHNPGISDLACELSNSNQPDLATGGISTIAVDTDSWSQVFSCF